VRRHIGRCLPLRRVQSSSGLRVEADIGPIRRKRRDRVAHSPNSFRLNGPAASERRRRLSSWQLRLIVGEAVSDPEAQSAVPSTNSSIAGPVCTNVSTRSSSIEPNDCACRYRNASATVNSPAAERYGRESRHAARHRGGPPTVAAFSNTATEAPAAAAASAAVSPALLPSTTTSTSESKTWTVIPSAQ